jgi:hypothetical protein
MTQSLTRTSIAAPVIWMPANLASVTVRPEISTGPTDGVTGDWETSRVL